jgi:hypothetical protein
MDFMDMVFGWSSATNAVGGPYCLDAGEAFAVGIVSGEAFSPGAHDGEAFTPGATAQGASCE